MSQRSLISLLGAVAIAASVSPALAENGGSAGGVAATIGATASPPVARGALTNDFASTPALVRPSDPVLTTGSIRRSEHGPTRTRRH